MCFGYKQQGFGNRELQSRAVWQEAMKCPAPVTAGSAMCGTLLSAKTITRGAYGASAQMYLTKGSD